MIETFRADLHCHTNCSDGSETPAEVIELALKKGLSGLSITDHDSIHAYETALPLAKEKGLSLISGVEFSTVHLGVSVHILGYSFSVKDPAILNLCAKHEVRRKARNQAILTLLAQHQMPITEEELDLSGEAPQTIGRPHIALAMVRKGYVKSIKEAFNKYIGDRQSCYSLGSYFTVEETIDVIHQANGFAVIAHPHLIRNSKVFKSLLEMNFDGLEGYYACFDAKEQNKWVKIAQNHGWLVTGGSDFHGSIKPAIPLGCSWVNQETFRLLEERFQQNN